MQLSLLVGTAVFCDGDKVIFNLKDTGKFVQGHKILKRNYKQTMLIYIEKYAQVH